jgi:hypothetical protein
MFLNIKIDFSFRILEIERMKILFIRMKILFIRMKILFIRMKNITKINRNNQLLQK